MAYNEIEIKEGKDALDRRERIIAKSGATNTENYCNLCKKQFKNSHGLAIHNAGQHKGLNLTEAKIDILEAELNRLKHDIEHPLLYKIKNGEILQEIIELSDSLDLSKEQILKLIQHKKEELK